MVEMQAVASTNILAVGYDHADRALHVEFHSGATYVYEDVPESTFEALLEADSKGSYLNREIKPNYSCHIA